MIQLGVWQKCDAIDSKVYRGKVASKHRTKNDGEAQQQQQQQQTHFVRKQFIWSPSNDTTKRMRLEQS